MFSSVCVVTCGEKNLVLVLETAACTETQMPKVFCVLRASWRHRTGIEGRQEVRGRLFIRVLAPNSHPAPKHPLLLKHNPKHSNTTQHNRKDQRPGTMELFLTESFANTVPGPMRLFLALLAALYCGRSVRDSLLFKNTKNNTSTNAEIWR